MLNVSGVLTNVTIKDAPGLIFEVTSTQKVFVLFAYDLVQKREWLKTLRSLSGLESFECKKKKREREREVLFCNDLLLCRPRTSCLDGRFCYKLLFGMSIEVFFNKQEGNLTRNILQIALYVLSLFCFFFLSFFLFSTIVATVGRLYAIVAPQKGLFCLN